MRAGAQLYGSTPGVGGALKTSAQSERPYKLLRHTCGANP